jgi:hypothetical protein
VLCPKPLVVAAVHPEAPLPPCQGREACPRKNLDGVETGYLALRLVLDGGDGQILEHRPATGHIQELQAAADPQHRQPALPAVLQCLTLQLVSVRDHRAAEPLVHLTIAAWVHGVPAVQN